MGSTAEDISNRIENAPHLEEASAAAIKEEVDESAGLTKRKPPNNNPRDKEDYPFKLNYVDARGKIWEGDFVNKILTIKQRRLVGPLQSKLLLGVDIVTLPASSIELAAMQAHIMFSLTEKPPWVENLDDINDPNVVYAIYEEVASHESFFQRDEKGEGKSES